MSIAPGPKNMEDFERAGREKIMRDEKLESDTPRTDALDDSFVNAFGPQEALQILDFARQLERELAEMTSHADTWMETCRKLEDEREASQSATGEQNRRRIMDWIKASEQLPPSGKNVLVYVGSIVTGYYLEITKDWWSAGYPLQDKVTHWMPLPSAPDNSKAGVQKESGGE